MQNNTVYKISFRIHKNSRTPKCNAHITFFSSYLSSKIQEIYLTVKQKLSKHISEQQNTV